MIDGDADTPQRFVEEGWDDGHLNLQHSEGKFYVLLGIEGGHSIENSLALLRMYHRLGLAT